MKLASLAAAAGLAALVLAVTLLASAPLCACQPAGHVFVVAFKTNPMKDGPEMARAAFLSRIPAGSSLSRLRAEMQQVYDERCKENLVQSTATCTFEMAEGWFGQFRTGFEFTVSLGPRKTVEDVRFRAFKRWI